MNYYTPGVYVEEISTLPPSVVSVSTAVPAFIGYTQKGPINTPTRISTLLEYTSIFGGPETANYTVETDGENILSITKDSNSGNYLMYYHLSMYFNNGGGSCYIISVGTYGGQETLTPERSHFEAGLSALEKEDEPTLILLTDAVNLNPLDYYALCSSALMQCGKLKDRFAILDVLDGNESVSDFRNASLPSEYLKYGAAYTPYLKTVLTYHSDPQTVAITGLNAPQTGTYHSDDENQNGILVTYTGFSDEAPKINIFKIGSFGFEFDAEKNTLIINGINQGTDGKTPAEIVSAWNSFTGNKGKFNITQSGDGSANITDSVTGDGASFSFPNTGDGATNLESIKTSKTGLYSSIKTALNNQRITLPPSGAMAGIYARVDGTRGVWKAPANVNIVSTIGPAIKITHEEQEKLNVDPEAGKSINAIRSFAGKGTLVWGARTLAGNDNEWRYIPVRRLFNLIEESTQKSTAFAVFEPNDATTWLKVKAMIDTYLYALWQQGALAGSAPEQAYFVNVGLGKTMTPQDILEGRLIVEIGIAAVRPAEFIILRFSHKLQEA